MSSFDRLFVIGCVLGVNVSAERLGGSWALLLAISCTALIVKLLELLERSLNK